MNQQIAVLSDGVKIDSLYLKNLLLSQAESVSQGVIQQEANGTEVSVLKTCSQNKACKGVWETLWAIFLWIGLFTLAFLDGFGMFPYFLSLVPHPVFCVLAVFFVLSIINIIVRGLFFAQVLGRRNSARTRAANQAANPSRFWSFLKAFFNLLWFVLTMIAFPGAPALLTFVAVLNLSGGFPLVPLIGIVGFAAACSILFFGLWLTLQWKARRAERELATVEGSLRELLSPLGQEPKKDAKLEIGKDQKYILEFIKCCHITVRNDDFKEISIRLMVQMIIAHQYAAYHGTTRKINLTWLFFVAMFDAFGKGSVSLSILFAFGCVTNLALWGVLTGILFFAFNILSLVVVERRYGLTPQQLTLAALILHFESNSNSRDGLQLENSGEFTANDKNQMIRDIEEITLRERIKLLREIIFSSLNIFVCLLAIVMVAFGTLHGLCSYIPIQMPHLTLFILLAGLSFILILNGYAMWKKYNTRQIALNRVKNSLEVVKCFVVQESVQQKPATSAAQKQGGDTSEHLYNPPGSDSGDSHCDQERELSENLSFRRSDTICN